MVKVILLIGVQGSGKTWVFTQLIDKYKLHSKHKLGKIRFHSNDNIVMAGVYNGEMFQGSDKLSMSVVSDYDRFLSYLATKGKQVILLLEGDRFTNSKVISNTTFTPEVIKIIDDGVKGRLKRGSNQSEGAIKRMTTRVSNITPTAEVKDSEEALKHIESLIHLYNGR